MAIMQAQTTLTNAEAAVSSAMTDDAKLAAYREVQRAADNLVTALTTHGGSDADIAAAASKSGNAAVMADNLAQKIADDSMAADAAMMALARKLHANIDNLRSATVSAAATYSGGDFRIQRSASGVGSTPVVLSEDKMAMVAANHGWEGMKLTAAPSGDGTYEAVVYSNVGAPTQGKKFGGAAANNEFEYALTNGAVTVTTATAGVAPLVDIALGQTAGLKRYPLPSPNPSGDLTVTIPGSYHGVAGTYSCTPGAGAICAVNTAASGFQVGTVPSATDNTFSLDGGTWTFKPADPNARVTDSPDTNYASYGWWIFESEVGSTFHASAFAIVRGTVPNAAGVTALLGTATYSGGAAGKYALISSTGGTNDAGHFTADATLKANFNTNMVTGTIDNFMGADGMSRDWSVELKENGVGNTGFIDSFGDGTGTGEDTVWTIGGTAATGTAVTNGDWTGALRNNGDDGVPQVATGTFYTEYNRVGKMVGAFGATIDE